MHLRQLLRRRSQKALVGSLALAVMITPALAATRSSSSFHVGTNTALKTVHVSKGPQEIRVVTLNPGTAVPDIAPADPQFPMWALTSTMSAAAGALAGVNGDFVGEHGVPKHTLMIDGELWSTGQASGRAIAWSADGQTAFIGHPKLKIVATNITNPYAFNIADWNVGTPRGGTIQGYTTRGGTVTRPPGKTDPTATDPHWCEARLVPVHPIAWGGGGERSLIRRYKVEAQPEPCPKTPLGFGTSADAVVVAAKANSTKASKITALKAGDTVRISWTLKGWPRVTDVMGAMQMLVVNGNNVAPGYSSGDNYILNYNPRTAAGITKGCSDRDSSTVCKLLLVTVDGRQTSTNWSKGVRLPYLANELIRAGAWMAVNFDGGGSTTLWVKKKDTRYCQSTPSVGGCLANRPSQSSGERATSSAIVILPSTDTGTPSQLR